LLVTAVIAVPVIVMDDRRGHSPPLFAWGRPVAACATPAAWL